jgi:hypothetical protein
MPKSEIFLDYHGPVNLPVIDLLLVKLKKTKEFNALNKTTGKRAYAFVVECLEDIFYYSALKSSDDIRMQPRISVSDKDDKIIIVAGNTILKDMQGKLVRMLDQLNQSDEATLKTKYEDKIKSDLKHSENGAGLGFIYMALKSGNRINYSFTPLTDDYLYFEIKISLNKYIS